MRHPIETIGASEARTHLSRLLRETESGRVFHITHRGRLVAELHPPAPAAPAAARGDLRGKIEMGDDFFAPLDDFREYT